MRGLCLFFAGFTWCSSVFAAYSEDSFFQSVTKKLIAHESLEMEFLVPSLSCAGNAHQCRDPEQIILDAMVQLSSNPEHVDHIRSEFVRFKDSSGIVDSVEGFLHYRQLHGLQQSIWQRSLESKLNLDRLTNKEKRRLYLLSQFHKQWPDSLFWRELKQSLHLLFKKKKFAENLRKKNKLASDLIYGESQIDRYKRGAYVNGVRIVMFCPDSRVTPCLMFIRKANGDLLKRSDGTIWHQPALALSSHGKSYYERNGNTPSGIYQIDGVMPFADQKYDFGNFRRLILNFISPSVDEKNHLYLLPESNHKSDWWNEAVVARDLGRGLLRIHGTGRQSDITRPYYPFVATSGCVAKRENIYDGIPYFDQRLLLDTLMSALNMEPNYDNEERIIGLLYVMNIGTEEVTLRSLYARHILR